MPDPVFSVRLPARLIHTVKVRAALDDRTIGRVVQEALEALVLPKDSQRERSGRKISRRQRA